MAKLIDDVDVVMGRLIKVWNTERKAFSNSAKFYVSLQVENADGSGESSRTHSIENFEIKDPNIQYEPLPAGGVGNTAIELLRGMKTK